MVEIVEGFIPMPGAPADFYDRCIRCLVCERGCPARVISRDEGGFPIVAEGRPRDTCEICGVCIAECPVKALDPKLVEKGSHYPTRTIEIPPPETHAPMLPPHRERLVE